jgi:hypothetical protein
VVGLIGKDAIALCDRLDALEVHLSAMLACTHLLDCVCRRAARAALGKTGSS